MKQLFDVVNFNPDASCLPSKDWIKAMAGGTNSQFFQWLNLYTLLKKKMILGITGSAVADLRKFNPETIDLINAHPDIFEVVIRPFSHDIALLRSRKGFEINVEWGLHTLRKEFRNISNFYLPPEFMLTAEQIEILSSMKFKGIFINPFRMRESTPNTIPSTPYLVRGIFQSVLPCIPVAGYLVQHYLECIQNFKADPWSKAVLDVPTNEIFFWRDGESPFLIPNGIDRERFWLEHESSNIQRMHLSELSNATWTQALSQNGEPRVYPLHPFSAWLREFRLMGFLRRMFSIENSVGTMGPEELGLWMYIINSDVLSSVEKKSPRVSLKVRVNESNIIDFLIQRSDRHLEGEECMVLLEKFDKKRIEDYLRSEPTPSSSKLKARLEYLSVNEF